MTFKKGDLVMVARPKDCCPNMSLGHIFTVSGVIIADIYCDGCGREKDGVLVVESDSMDFVVESSRLIKINPPADDTEEVADKELEIVK